MTLGNPTPPLTPIPPPVDRIPPLAPLRVTGLRWEILDRFALYLRSRTFFRRRQQVKAVIAGDPPEGHPGHSGVDKTV